MVIEWPPFFDGHLFLGYIPEGAILKPILLFCVKRFLLCSDDFNDGAFQTRDYQVLAPVLTR